MRHHNVEERIKMRNKEAAYHMEHHGEGFSRQKAEAGLKAANVIDEVTSIGQDEKTIFTSMLVTGAVRGAFYGAVAAFIGVACLGGAAALPLYGGLMAAGAALFAIVDSQTELELHVNNNSRTLADRVAEASGAVPSKMQEIAFDETFRKSWEREEYADEVTKLLKERGIEIDKERKPGSPDYYRNQEELRKRQRDHSVLSGQTV